MDDLTNLRKIEHIDIIEKDAGVDRRAGHFDKIHLIHRALPEIDLNAIDPGTTFLGKKLSFPLLISSMTGGDHTLLRKINRHLAEAAEHCNVAMAVGSQRILFENKKAEKSFDLRPLAPTIPLIANLGAVQLNYGFDLSHCIKAVEILNADGLYFHLNPLQEAIQQEGNTNFSSLLSAIGHINQQLPVPVLLKEVGCGMCAEDINACIKAGIKYIDIAGQGGTSWSRIEHHRTGSDDTIGLLFQDWGIPTPTALKIARTCSNEISLIASGGLTNGLDMVKSVILGANLCGMAGSLLKAGMRSTEHVVAEIESLKRAFVTTMFLVGAPDINYLRGNSKLLLDRFI